MKYLLILFAFWLISCSAGKEKAARPVDLIADNTLDQWDFNLEDSLLSLSDIWQINDGVLFCSGEVKGYIFTREDYANYKLSFEWRWPQGPGNSGVLLHISQPDSIWPHCIEAQLKADNAGDFIMMGGSTISEQQDPANRRVPKFKDDIEKAPGEWNRYEITCKDDSITIHINGVVQNKASKASLRMGKIGLQSEGKAIEFKNIMLQLL